MADYTQPSAVTQRVRFFDGQYLTDQDFIDEQKYHLDRERRLGRSLRVTGIVDGLTVVSPAPKRIAVKPGTAIDSEGRFLVLAQDRTLNLTEPFVDKKSTLLIAYREQVTLPSSTGGEGDRRWLEDPWVVAVTEDGNVHTAEEGWDSSMPAVVLAEFRFGENGVVVVDEAAAERAGMSIPGTLVANLVSAGRLEVRGSARFGEGSDAAWLVPNAGYFSIQGSTNRELLTVTQSNGDVGIGATPPVAKLDVARPDDMTAQASLNVRAGNDAELFGNTQLTFSWGNGSEYRHAIKTRHNGGDQPGNALDFYLWDQGVDQPGAIGTRHTLTLEAGNVGIGTTSPRTALDTGTGVMSGASNDYVKTQFLLTGGGRVTWSGNDAQGNGFLRWTERFIAMGMEEGSTFAEGHVSIYPPTNPIPAGNVHDGRARAVTVDGVTLRNWEVLYAEHTVGGRQSDLAFHIRLGNSGTTYFAPSNWIVIATVNAEDHTVRLGTGVILGAKSTSTGGSPVPTGTIVMWSGDATNIPGGWALCDGRNGTPNLLTRFIVAAHPTEAGYGPGVFGEPDQHTHATNVAPVGRTTGDSAAHVHAFPTAWQIHGYNHDVIGANTREGIDPFVPGNNAVYGRRIRDYFTTETGGVHSHPVPTLGQFTSSSSADANRPKWYALCFIMKL